MLHAWLKVSCEGGVQILADYFIVPEEHNVAGTARLGPQTTILPCRDHGSGRCHAKWQHEHANTPFAEHDGATVPIASLNMARQRGRVCYVLK